MEYLGEVVKTEVETYSEVEEEIAHVVMRNQAKEDAPVHSAKEECNVAEEKPHITTTASQLQDDSQLRTEFKIELDVAEAMPHWKTENWRQDTEQVQSDIQPHPEWSRLTNSHTRGDIDSEWPGATNDESESNPRCNATSVRKLFLCTECDATFTFNSSLKRHMRKHRGEKPYSCTECEATFTESGNLKKHMQRHRGEKPYSCTECEASFTESGNFKRHMQKHRGEKPFSCTECEATFTESGNLKRHMRRHRGEKPYSCTECEASFTHSDSLKVHIRTHRGEKPYSCTECEAAFSHSGNLKVHMRIHTGERPYSCTKCEAKFTRSGTLKRHMQVHDKTDKKKPCLVLEFEDTFTE